ncbi:MAG: hypothetical protein Q9160_003230 [Pyrenula sp. 1 TL-2023]
MKISIFTIALICCITRTARGFGETGAWERTLIWSAYLAEERYGNSAAFHVATGCAGSRDTPVGKRCTLLELLEHIWVPGPKDLPRNGESASDVKPDFESMKESKLDQRPRGSKDKGYIPTNFDQALDFDIRRIATRIDGCVFEDNRDKFTGAFDEKKALPGVQGDYYDIMKRFGGIVGDLQKGATAAAAAGTLETSALNFFEDARDALRMITFRRARDFDKVFGEDMEVALREALGGDNGFDVERSKITPKFSDRNQALARKFEGGDAVWQRASRSKTEEMHWTMERDNAFGDFREQWKRAELRLLDQNTGKGRGHRNHLRAVESAMESLQDALNCARS